MYNQIWNNFLDSLYKEQNCIYFDYRGFDFGNHFCEWCFDYQTAPEYPYYSYHPEDYPSRENQYEFFKKYLNASGTSYVTDKMLQDLYREANTFALASHFFWGLWSVVQGEISDIEFGFMDYAVCRLDAYFRWKPVVSSILNDWAEEIQNIFICLLLPYSDLQSGTSSERKGDYLCTGLL